MKRVTVKCVDGSTIVINADRLETLVDDSNYIVAKAANEIVGVFDMGTVSAMYMTETRKNENPA